MALQLLTQTTESIAAGLQSVEEAVADLQSQVSKFVPSTTTVIVPPVTQSTGMSFSSVTLCVIQTHT